jgi:DNA-binding transcriptional LysR family regulator
MNGRQIEIFHAVMRTGTVTEAAERLGVTQPAVTAGLKQIEATLGFNLFHRSGGRLHPTEEARILIGEAERIQDSLDVFRKMARRLKQDLVEHLRIATPPAFSHGLIPDAISDFIEDNPACLIDVTTQHHEQILNDLASKAGGNSLGFTFGLGERRGIGSVSIGKARLVALVPGRWDLAKQSCVSVEEIANGPVVGTFQGEPLGDAVDRLMRSSQLTPDPVIRVHNHSLAAQLAIRGIGATIIDSLTAYHIESTDKKGEYALIPLAQSPPLDVTAVYSYEHPLNRHAKTFIDGFRQHYNRLGDLYAP